MQQAASLANQISTFGMQIASDKNGKTNVAKSKELFDYQLKRTLEQNKDIQEQLSKPYYQWQLRNNPRLNVEGLKAAGINPLLAYGQNAGLSSSSEFAPTEQGDFAGILSQGIAQEQLELTRQSTSADVIKKLAETSNIKQDTRSKETYNSFQRQLLDGEIKTQQGNIYNLQMDAAVKKEQVEQIRSLVTQIDASTDNLQQQTANLAQTLSILRQQERINDATLDNIVADTALKVAQEVRTNFGVNVDKAQIQQLQGSIRLMALQGNAYYPAQVLAQWLSGNSSLRSQYAESMVKGQIGLGNLQFSQGQQGQLQFNIQSGNFPAIAKDAWNRATEGQTGASKYVFGTLAVGQQAVNILTNNIGSLLGGLSGFVK